tara:strand:+ start:1226 stop:1867 length:642 start_codon:yes stop_codon:yes gene_type:complete
MANQEVTFSNFYESTLADILASGSNTMTLTAAPTSNGTSNIAAPYYLVIDPDEPAKREVVLVTAASGTSISGMTRDVEGRHSPDPTHVGGTTVRMAVVKEMFEDVHDRIDAGFILEDGDGTEVTIAQGKEVKFIDGAALNINWTDVSDGSDSDPYDLTFDVDINGATDGTSVVVDGANDLVLLYDATDATVKKVKTSQIAEPADINPFLVMGA